MKCIYKKFDSAHVSWVKGVIEAEQGCFDLPNLGVVFGGRASPLMGVGSGRIMLYGTITRYVAAVAGGVGVGIGADVVAVVVAIPHGHNQQYNAVRGDRTGPNNAGGGEGNEHEHWK